MVCISADEAIALVKWELDVRLVQRATERCSLIEWVAE